MSCIYSLQLRSLKCLYIKAGFLVLKGDDVVLTLLSLAVISHLVFLV